MLRLVLLQVLFLRALVRTPISILKTRSRIDYTIILQSLLARLRLYIIQLRVLFKSKSLSPSPILVVSYLIQSLLLLVVQLLIIATLLIILYSPLSLSLLLLLTKLVQLRLVIRSLYLLPLIQLLPYYSILLLLVPLVLS